MVIPRLDCLGLIEARARARKHLPDAPSIPRLDCLGLIEAFPTFLSRADRLRFRGLIASASLKPGDPGFFRGVSPALDSEA